MRFIVSVLSLTWTLVACADSDRMQDPLLGLSFDPDRVQFEAAPDMALTEEDKCRGTWYLFAKYADPRVVDRNYLLISGLVSVHGDMNPQSVVAIEPDFGFVAQCNGADCRVLGVPDRLFGDLGLPDYIVTGIVTDAVNRLVVAFGGKGELQENLDALASLSMDHSIETEMLRALQAAGLDMMNWTAK